jgi:flagellin-like hook-associated protein FlgL
MEGVARSINDQIQTAIAGGGAAVRLEGTNASVVDGEIRLSYEKPSSASNTIGNTIVIAGAAGNAESVGLIDGSYSGFVDGKKNHNDVVWGFSRSIDSASYNYNPAAAVVISISDGVGGETITVMNAIGRAAGSVSDMVLFTDFQANVNRLLDAATVAIRVDQIGGAMAFTSLKVGTLNRDNMANHTSMVTLRNFAAGSSAMILDRFGFSAGTSKGSGDTNFKMHVVDRQAQFQIGADQGQTMKINIANMGSEALGVDNLDLTNISGANEAMGKLNKAIDMVSSERSKLGAYQNRLEYAINNLRNTNSNLTASESRIRDADIAMEMIEFTRNQIVQQSGTAMLAQANMVPQGVLQLLG